jgi:hypothetical protein
MIHFHGNGEVGADYVNSKGYLNWFSNFNVNIFFFEYRGNLQHFNTFLYYHASLK